MKKIIIGVAILIMLMGGGVSVMKSMGIGPFAPVQTGDDIAFEDNKKKDLEPVNVPMEPLTIPVFNGDQIATTLQVEIHLEALGEDNGKELKRILPKVSDLFLRDLHGYLPRLVESQGELDVEVIQRRLISVALKSPITKDLVNKVRIQAISDTPASPR